MNRIDKLFDNKDNNILSIYITAGFPGLNDTLEILQTLQENGIDMVEIGIPFSDPIADGPIIQASSTKALNNGISLKNIFEQINDMRRTVSIPVVLMGYLNPILMYGFDRFCKDCQSAGIDGVIIPDLPLDEYRDHYKDKFSNYGIHFIMLVSPVTEQDRLVEICSETGGFIYAVSNLSTTGGRTNLNEREEYFSRIRKNTNKPILIGFGVSDRSSFLSATRLANGAIIGSAYIKALAEGGDIKRSTEEFIGSILL